MSTEWEQIGTCASNDLEDMQDENAETLQDENGEDLVMHGGVYSCKDTDWNNIL